MSQKHRHIIVVDDEAPMRGLLHDFFHTLGYQVECFSTGGAVLKRLQENNATVSAVIADIRMTPMNGMELLQKVKATYPTLPVVLITSAGGPKQRDEAMKHGALHYLTKPFSLSELEIIVDKVTPEPDPGRNRNK